MHIIITLKNIAVIVDYNWMMKSMMGSIGECRFGQIQYGAAKYIWNFVHSVTVMTEGIHLNTQLEH